MAIRFSQVIRVVALAVAMIAIGGCVADKAKKSPATAAAAPTAQAVDEASQAAAFDDAKHDVDAYLGVDSVLQSAEAKLNAILSKNPKYARAYVELSRIVMKRSLIVNFDHETAALDEAESLLDKAKSLDPTYADAYVVSSYLYILKGDYPKSAAQYNEARNRNARSPWLELNKALALYRQEHYDEARAIYETYVKRFSVDDPLEQQNAYREATTELMQIAYIQGNRELVKHYAEQLTIAARTEDAWSWGNAAGCLVGQGYFDLGIEYARHALGIRPYGLARAALAEGLYGKWGLGQTPDQPDLSSPLLKEAQALRPDMAQMAGEFMRREGSNYKMIGARLYEVLATQQGK